MRKNNQTNASKDVAKFVAGIVAADLIGAIWFLGAGYTSFVVLGLNITPSVAAFGIAFDSLLLLALIHYAWHPDIIEPNISKKMFFIFVGSVTCIVAALHIGRLVFGLDLILGDWHSPMWLSWIGALITAYISYTSFHLAGICK
jgi:hypothetical protein